MNLIKKSIITRILALSLLASIIIGSTLIWVGFQIKDEYFKTIDEDLLRSFHSIHETFELDVDQFKNELGMGLEMLSTNQIVRIALMNGDRPLLINQLETFYEQRLKALYHTANFQFYSKDNLSFYRFEDPSRNGDDVSSYRETVVQANASNKAISGLEAGKEGLFYRVVQPLSENQTPIGAVETGMDFISFLKDFGEAHKIQIALGLRNSVLDKSNFKPESTFGSSSDSQYVLVQGDLLQKELPNLKLAQLDENGEFVTIDKSPSLLAKFPVLNFQNKEIGHLIFLLPIQASISGVQTIVMKGGIALFIMVVLLAVLYTYQLIRYLFKPLKLIMESAKNLEEGDLSQSIDYRSEDEVGRISQSMNQLSLKLGILLEQVKVDSTSVQTAANSLTETSEEFFRSSKSMKEKSGEIAMGSEELSLSLSQASEKTEEGSSNINMVAAAGEELSATISEIARNTDRTRVTMEEAVSKVASANSQIRELETSAEEITKVISVIVEIAEQTKLLALNATIEAARAGEAGKGFNVVANEVKELAAQTNSATEEIKKKILGIQNSTQVTIKDFDAIHTVMTEANDMVTNIAAAVEQQAVTTREIAENITQAADRLTDVNLTTNQSCEVATKIRGEVDQIETSSNDVYSNSSAIRARAEEMKRVGSDLNSSVAKFKISEASKQHVKATESRDFIVWGPQYSVGIQTIDIQHKKLIAIINELHDALKLKKSKDVLGAIIKKLIDYTEFHFNDEQSMMESADYPKLKDHIKIHHALIDQVLDYQKQFLDGNMQMSDELMAFLKDWLLNHIMVQDKQYTPYMKKKGIN